MNLPPADYHDMQMSQQQQPEEEIFNLRTALSVVLDNWPIAVGLFALGIATGVYKSWIAPPVFESIALVEVESQKSGFAVGPEDMGSYSPYNMSNSITAQIEILKSRRILGEAAEQLGLTMNAQPRYMGSINATRARNYKGEAPASAPWYIPGSGKYAWGGERIELAGFRVSDALLGKTLTLVAGADGAFELKTKSGGILGQGKIGTELKAETAEGEISLQVSALVARPGTEFMLRRISMKDAADALRLRMTVAERGAKGVFSGSGILGIAVKAASPREAADSANAIAGTYLRQNVEKLSQGAERKLDFLNSQLPRLQQELSSAEQALLEQRTKSGPFQLSDGAKSILDSLTTIEREASTLQLQRAELSQTVTPEHPAMAALDRKLNQLQTERARINSQIAALPDAESRQLQLMRDSKVAGELYVSLLNKAQELKVAKAGTVGNVRIIDDAMAESTPVEPKVQRILLSWSALGLIAGLAAVFLRKHLNVKLEWAEDAEKRLGLPVYATVPYSPREMELDSRTGGKKTARRLLAEDDPQDIAVESLRSLRASLHFAMMDAKRNLVVITGSTPGVGKSFIAANLAKLVADSKRKVLLIDADLRKGRMHKMLGFDRGPGLSELIAGQSTLAEVQRQIGTDNFWVITTGKLPPNPAELLASERFIEIVEAARKDFDMVIVDTPPVLNLADGLVVARSAGAVFVTVRGGQSTVPDVQDCLQRFAKNGIKVDGLIFNGMRFSIGSYVHPTYYHYRYRYTRYGGKAK